MTPTVNTLLLISFISCFPLSSQEYKQHCRDRGTVCVGENNTVAVGAHRDGDREWQDTVTVNCLDRHERTRITRPSLVLFGCTLSQIYEVVSQKSRVVKLTNLLLKSTVSCVDCSTVPSSSNCPPLLTTVTNLTISNSHSTVLTPLINSVVKCRNIYKLTLDDNGLSIINIPKLNNIQDLSVRRNNIRRVDNRVLSSLDKLGKLDLSNNKIHSLPSHCFSKNNNLEQLRLRNNSIGRIHRRAFLGIMIAELIVC